MSSLFSPKEKTYKKSRPNIRLFTIKNKNKFGKEINNIDWISKFGAIDDPNLLYDSFIIEIKKIYEKCFPLTPISRKAIKDKIWLSPALKVSSKHKNILYNKFLLSRSTEDENAYKKYINNFDKLSKSAENKYYEDLFNNKINSTKNVEKY